MGGCGPNCDGGSHPLPVCSLPVWLCVSRAHSYVLTLSFLSWLCNVPLYVHTTLHLFTRRRELLRFANWSFIAVNPDIICHLDHCEGYSSVLSRHCCAHLHGSLHSSPATFPPPSYPPPRKVLGHFKIFRKFLLFVCVCVYRQVCACGSQRPMLTVFLYCSPLYLHIYYYYY